MKLEDPIKLQTLPVIDSPVLQDVNVEQNDKLDLTEKEKDNRRDKELIAIYAGSATEESKKEAFNKIVDNYYKRIFGFAYSFLKDRDAAKSATWEVLEKASRKLRVIQIDSLYAWLFRVTKNLCISLLRNRKQTNKNLSIDEFPDLELTGRASSLSEEINLAEFSESISWGMKNLSPLHREIITMYDEGNMTYDEIAEKLGINVDAVKNRMFRARKKLTEIIVSRFPEFKNRIKARN